MVMDIKVVKLIVDALWELLTGAKNIIYGEGDQYDCIAHFLVIIKKLV